MIRGGPEVTALDYVDALARGEIEEAWALTGERFRRRLARHWAWSRRFELTDGGWDFEQQAEVVVVAAAGAGDGAPFVGLPLLHRPSPSEWGRSYLRRGNRSSICNGTSNAGVFVHCGCRGLNMYVISARSRVFSLFSSTKSRLSII